MHVPDGFLDASTSLATAAVAVGAVGLALRRAEREIAETGPALPGLAAAFVFATQMVNFPVGAGTSGHLLGGALVAALVGPWTAILVMSVVLVVQALVFADGGITALGTNVTLMAVLAVVVGYAVSRALSSGARRRARLVAATAIGGFLSVPAAALAFTGLYTVGGTVPIPAPTLAAAMVGWHVLIGVGEALITAAVLTAVLATRPDLVFVARRRLAGPVLLDAQGRPRPEGPAPAPAATDLRERRPFLVGLLVALVVGGVVSLAASAHPDGLEHVASVLGFGDAARDSVTAASPLAEYVMAGGDGLLPASLAGVAGVLLAVVAGLGVAALARRRPVVGDAAD